MQLTVMVANQICMCVGAGEANSPNSRVGRQRDLLVTVYFSLRRANM
jgi:hypothetical protein